MPNALTSGVINHLASGGTSPASLYDTYQGAQTNALNRQAFQQKMDAAQLEGLQKQVNDGLVQLIGEVSAVPEEQRAAQWDKSMQRITSLHPELGRRFGGLQYGPQSLAAIEGGLRERGLMQPRTQVSAEGAPFEAMQDGRPVFVQRYSDGSVKPVEGFAPPPKTPTGSGRPMPVVDPQSATGFTYRAPEDAVGQPAPAPRSPSNNRYSQREQQAARDKLRLIRVAKQQLQNVKNRWAGGSDPATGEEISGIKGTFSAGPLSTWTTFTEGGDRFDAAVSQLTPALAAITRVPGVGAMSDYETRLQEATRPQRGRFEATTDDQIAGVELLLDQLEAGYGGIIQDSEEMGAPGVGESIEDLIEHYAGQE